MGSAILYSAINDLDLNEPQIPQFTPPGMLPALAQTSDESTDRIEKEAESRGSTKYEEQAEMLLKD